MTQRYSIASKDFGTLSYRKSGRGPILVLLHGFPEDSGLWCELVPLMDEKFTLLLPDLPGTGESALPADLSVEQMADAVKVITDQEAGPSPFVLGGHSMGGYVALAFAEKYGDKLLGLSLIHSTAAADNEEKKENRRKAIALIGRGGRDAFLKGMVPGLFSEATKAARPGLLTTQLERAMSMPAESLVAFYEAMIKRPDRKAILQRAPFPVQWIIGNDDATIPPDSVLPQTQLSDRTFVSAYPHTAHMSMLEVPARLAEDLEAFLHYCHQKHSGPAGNS